MRELLRNTASAGLLGHGAMAGSEHEEQTTKDAGSYPDSHQ